ncbi:copper amine oxidase N-terminal domain-containing protein [Paenibacillus sp. G2S3]|uniref:copper amine oxidase N-terminal domain-containing protein n=1 Tax=Paenibacillus sp. G2S3 TaxID=3047872 RepID=UPI0024C108C5|nr:copper amine oxidase N-terminal domain-containing protein [Paenibacillus sp. G2S3]WHY20944.1 copper amine oxidase N-terminal domain-containing protein [Paenibacillus sp. G2S3]
MKKLMSSLVVLLMVALFSSNFSGLAASLPLRVIVNGEKVNFPDAQPFIDAQQRVQLPVRFISEALGAKVLWDSKAKKATISLDGKTMGVYIGKKSYELNGKTKQMDTAALFKQSRTFVPLRFVYEGLGVNVKWDDAVKTVYITTPGNEPPPSSQPTTSTEPKEAVVLGFKIPYTEMGPSLDPAYVSESKMVVTAYEKVLTGYVDMEFTISFTQNGADPVQAMNETEAILRQQIESNVVDSIMSYVRSKKQRSDALPYKLFEAKNYKIDVVSPGMDDIGIGLYKK